LKLSGRLTRTLTACLLSAVSYTNLPAASAAEANWPQWRGPGGAGVSEERDLPLEWGATQNITWKTPLPGKGHSSPIVWGRRVFVTTAIEGPVVAGAKAMRHVIGGKDWLHPDSVGADRRHTFKVVSLDRETGKILWERTAWEGTPYDDRHRKSSYAASTPATDGRLVYAFFGAEGLYAYDYAGRLAWKADLGRLGSVGLGTGTSPIIYKDLVIVQCDMEDGAESFIVAINKRTGRQVWKTPRRVQVSWSTPVIVQTAKRAELITSGNEAVISYDPATGRELWRSRGVESNAIPSPVATSEMVIISAGFPAKIAYAIRLGGSGDLSAPSNLVWSYTKGTAYVTSPILYGGHLYLTTDKGILTCLDALTGEVRYEGGRVPVPATFTASPVAFDGKILLTSEDGDTFIVRAGPKHEIIRTNSLGEPVYASPAIAGGSIFVRGERHLYRISRSK
jgi:outer membrane protein assembly factor BamB